ncbi:translation initiation factor IF-6 [Methanocaldococcus sp.]|uniref:translation initiation factor IF-6 n=1 Tax=Methanocaldococcus sp. TaxID=2152917 RepID=UPI002620577A|nr:translation initiation factor IF-6 [Methanocaldococcus sp.]MCQ6253799.1 translation initiation factor IF-6 [Methanocaldococcus sp.]
MIIRKYFSGISTIGVLAMTTEDITLLPIFLDKNDVKEVSEVLKTKCLQVNIGGSSLLGSLSVGNKYSLLLPKIIDDEELNIIKNFLKENDLDLNIKIIKSKNTALGNLILTNDNGALISPELKEFKRDIEDALNVEVEVGTIADLPTVGSNAVVTNKGCLTHPLVEDEELEFLKNLFKVEYIGKGTANKGTTSVGACIIANSKGAIVGGDTTGPELLIIEDALGLI